MWVWIKMQLMLWAAIGIAAYQKDLAAIYIAAGVYMLLYMLNAIEMKLNKLLDHHDLSVPFYEIKEGWHRG
jgi:hypothetical protein